MIRYLLMILVLYVSSVFGDYSIVYVHVGDTVPTYADIAIEQARLFNDQARIILVSSRKGLERFHGLKERVNLELCSYDELPKSKLHEQYQSLCVEKSPFWRYTSERFLYLLDVMERYSLENVFHMENDIMLYANLEPLLPIFQKHYPGIGVTCDNEERCIPGFVWIANLRAMQSLAHYFVLCAPKKLNDMQVIGTYRRMHSSQDVDTLPIILPEYLSTHSLESTMHHKTNTPTRYTNHFEEFQAVFDAAAIGQFLGGIDPIHKNNGPGFINESCLFNVSIPQYDWIADEQGRSVPHMIFQGHRCKIINLHIHSKRLCEFRSL